MAATPTAMPLLPDDLWLIILQELARSSTSSLAACACVSRHFNRLVQTNSVWFAAFAASYGPPNGSLRLAGYRHNRSVPVDWQRKLRTSVRLETSWQWLGDHSQPSVPQAPAEAVGVDHLVDAVMADAGIPQQLAQPQPAPRQPMPASTAPAATAHLPPDAQHILDSPRWTDTLSYNKMLAYLRARSTEPLAFSFTSIVPDRSLMSAPAASTCIGISTLNFGIESARLSASIAFCFDVTADEVVVEGYTCWPQEVRDVIRTIGLVDVDRGVYCVMDETFPDREWQRILLFELPERGAGGGNASSSGSSDSSGSSSSSSDGDGNGDGNDGMETGENSHTLLTEMDLPDWCRWARAFLVPRGLPRATATGSPTLECLGQASGMPADDSAFQTVYMGDSANASHPTVVRLGPRDMVLLGWTSADARGVRAMVDTSVNPARLVHVRLFGDHVTSISEGDPYDCNMIVTGHDDEACTVRVWRLDTTDLLTVLSGHSTPVWGFAFLDDADDRDEAGMWVPPASLALLSVSDQPPAVPDDAPLETPAPAVQAQVVVWRLDDLALGTHLDARVWRSRSLSSPVSTRPSRPANPPHASPTAPPRDPRIVSQVHIPVPTGDLFSSFYVLHPLLYTISVHGTFAVYSLATGAMLYRIHDLGDGALRMDSSVSSALAFFTINRPANGAVYVMMRLGVVKVVDAMALEFSTIRRRAVTTAL
ncbi:hypothetical protein BC831DRAFT_456266 [Entophlyctis helioformis]|nr:hypothetical protein BC831DRAFT_456266 [Entophlyctis helioformis]